jgi:hypothetical protein
VNGAVVAADVEAFRVVVAVGDEEGKKRKEVMQ